jgi:hypothetical protein
VMLRLWASRLRRRVLPGSASLRSLRDGASRPFPLADAKSGNGHSARQHPCWHAECRSVACWTGATRLPLFVPAAIRPKILWGANRAGLLRRKRLRRDFVYPPPPRRGTGRKGEKGIAGFRVAPVGRSNGREALPCPTLPRRRWPHFPGRRDPKRHTCASDR